MSITKACCTRPAVESDYVPKGTEIRLGDLKIYEAGDPSATRLLVSVYDIFGFHPVTKQVCDKLGSTGFRVVMPDFFRGSPWTNENFPPKNMQDVMDWVIKEGSWPDRTKPDLLNVLEHYKKQGATSFGIFGFCWGGKISVIAGAELPEIKAAGLVHPSMIVPEEAEAVKCPVILLPSKDEPDMIPFYNTVKGRLGEDSVQHVRFDDMAHGFAAARGDLSDELNRKRLDEVLDLLSTFFDKHVK